MEQNLPDSPHLILGKLGINPKTIPAGPDRARVSAVREAGVNKISPYRKLRPNRLGMPKV